MNRFSLSDRCGSVTSSASKHEIAVKSNRTSIGKATLNLGLHFHCKLCSRRERPQPTLVEIHELEIFTAPNSVYAYTKQQTKPTDVASLALLAKYELTGLDSCNEG